MAGVSICRKVLHQESNYRTINQFEPAQKKGTKGGKGSSNGQVVSSLVTVYLFQSEPLVPFQSIGFFRGLDLSQKFHFLCQKLVVDMKEANLICAE